MKIHGMLLLAGLLVFPAVALEGADWSYREEVRYQGVGSVKEADAGWVFLEGGHELYVNYTGIKWRTLAGWKTGRRLVISYKPETGAVLLDPASGKHAFILASSKLHPIDIMWGRKFKDASTTKASVQCCVDTGKLWDRELNRIYRFLLAQSRPRPFSAKEKEQLINAQRKWIQFRDAQCAAIRTVYSKRLDSVRRVYAAEFQMEVTRQQVLRLSSFLHPRYRK